VSVVVSVLSLRMQSSVVAVDGDRVASPSNGAWSAGGADLRQRLTARYGLALALSNERDVTLLPEAIRSLDEALRVMRERRQEPAVWDATRGLLDQLSTLEAQEQVQAASDAVRQILVDRTTGPGAPIQIEQAALRGVLAKIEFAWVHGPVPCS